MPPLAAVANAHPLSLALADLASFFSRAQDDALEDSVRARIYAIQGALLEPVLRAGSREEYWEVRDRMFSDPQHVFAQADEVCALSRGLGGAKPRAILDRLDRYPPRSLRWEQLVALREGFALLYHPLPDLGPDDRDSSGGVMERGAMNEIASRLDEGVRRMFASVLLLSIWAVAMVCGDGPRNDDVSESIAQNFADVMGVFRGSLYCVVRGA